MKRLATIIFALAMSAAVAYSETGDLKPVSVSPVGVPRTQSYNCQLFVPRTEGDGTVSKNAIVGTVTMAGKQVKIAIDSNSPDANKPDVIRFDFTGAGKFGQTNVVPLQLRNTGQTDFMYGQFRGGDLVFDLNGKSIPVYVEGQYQRYTGGRNLYFTAVTGLEGTCEIGGKMHNVQITSGAGDFKIGQTTRRQGSIIRGDIVLLDYDPNRTSRIYFLDQPIQADGKWFKLKLSDDQSRISAEPIEIATGEIKTDLKVQSAKITLAGKKNFLVVGVSDKPITVPADNYVIVDYSHVIPPVAFNFSPAGKDVMLEVKGGSSVVIPIGKALIAKLDVSTHDGMATFNLSETDNCGMRARVSFAGGPVEGDIQQKMEAAKPKVFVYDSDGKEVYKATLEYG